MNRYFIISIIFLVCLKSSTGQEQLGLHLENYAGINAIAINPANSFLTPHTWDINIVSAGTFFSNNYGYINNINTYKLLKNISNERIEFDLGENKYYPAEAIIISFYDIKRQSYLALNGNMTGPSFSIKLDRKNSIGFVTGFRFAGSFPNIPDELSYYTYYNKPFYQSFPISAFNAGFISWQEYGLNYVNKIKGYTSHTLLGVTLKYLAGNDGLFFDNKKTFQFQQIAKDTIASLDRINVEYGYTSTNIKSNRFIFQRNGAGISIDIGATIVFGEDDKKYQSRLGVSLLDIGFINYNKNSLKYTIDIDTLSQLGINDLKKIKQLSQIDTVNKIINKQIFNRINNDFETNSFSMWLPMALSIQFDYSFSNLFYINSTIVQSISPKNHSIARGNLFAISPRIEHRWFSVSTPLILYNWKEFRLAASIRLAYLTIGSDNIFSVFSNQKQYSGSDLYFGLKFNPFLLGKKSKYRRNLNKNIKCYKF